MHRLADEGIALVLLDEHGRFKARLEGAVSGTSCCVAHNTSAAWTTDPTVEVARNRGHGKIRNCRQVLLRGGARESKSDEDSSALSRSADDLAAALRALPETTSLDALRGVEGEAARQYFSGLNRLVRPDARGALQMDGRTRRPPRDRMNAIMSFIYALLMNDCRSAVEASVLQCATTPSSG